MIPDRGSALGLSASCQLLARRVQLPVLLLVALLQRTPALRWLLVGDVSFAPLGPGFVLRSTAVLGVLATSVDTLAGATTEILNPTPPASATVGQQFDATFKVTGTPSEPVSYTVSNLPPGLTVPTSTTNTFGLLINAASGSISGVPTTAGTYDVYVTAWKKINATGPNYALTYRIVVAAGSGPVATAPTISAQPASISVTSGQSATFSVTASGTPTPTYQWRKDSAALSGATSSSYTLATTTTTDAGNYTVVVTNSAGSVTSSVATLTVTTPTTPPPTATAPAITAQPSPLTLTTGQAATLTVTASGTAPLSYQWQKDGVALPGATAAAFSLTSATTGDSGSYTVTVTNSAGSITSQAVSVSVTAPTTPPSSTPSTPAPTTPAASTPLFTAQPADLSTTVGRSGSFSATLSPDTGVTLVWQVSRNNGQTWTNLTDDATHRGSTTGTLTLAAIDATMNGRLYRLLATFSGGTVTSDSAALILPAALFAQPAGLVFDAQGRLIVADQSSNVLLRTTPGGSLALLTGTRGLAGAADGSDATFNQPVGLAVGPDGSLYIADSANALIRVRRPDGSLATLAGSASQRGFVNGANATFSAPLAVALDPAGNLYVADSANHLIRKITPTGVVSTFAGTGGVSGSRDGSDARFNTPSGLACDSAGNLYVADTNNNTIRKITPAGVVSTLAGLAGVSGAQDGSSATALLNQPRGLALSASGQLYVADTGNSSIRRVSPTGTVVTIAGLSSISGEVEHDDDDTSPPPSGRTWFDHPLAVACDATGNIYVADTGNRSLRRIATDGSVSTLSFTLETAHITGGATLNASAPSPTTPAPTPAATSSSGASSGGGGGGPSWLATLSLLLLLVARCRRP